MLVVIKIDVLGHIRHLPKHRLVLVVISHKHKACTRTNIHHYIPAVLLKLMTSRHLPKHRLVLVVTNHKHKACTITNIQLFPSCSVDIDDI